MTSHVEATPTQFPKSDPINFVLIHGAWHNGSSWDGVRKHLEAAGHKVYTPTCGGHGKGAEPVQTLDGAIEPVLKLIDENGLKDIVLLGHSFGGILITHIATKIPQKIKRMIYHNAFVCHDGEGLWDLLPKPVQEMYEYKASQSGNDTFALPFPLFRDHFIGDCDLDFAKKVYDDLSVQPIGQCKEKIVAGDFFDVPTIPRSVVHATDDSSLPLGGYAGLANKLGTFRYISLPGHHETLYSDPKALSRAIVLAGRD